MRFNKLITGKLLMYLLFWAVSFYVCLEVFSRTGEIRSIDVIYTLLFHIPMIFAVTIHSLHLLPNYLAKSRFGVYGLMLLFLYGASLPLYTFSFQVLNEWFFPGYYLVGVYDHLEVAGFITIYLILSSSLEFARSWFSALRAKNRIVQLESENKASELKALRAQVNPHFLFNSLNIIYNEALKKSDKAPGLILKLSDMLRYVVEKIDQEKVPLHEEVDYLTHFIDLHKERLNEPQKVTFKTEGEFTDATIAPLLLIIFIENCFKHSDLRDDDARIFIHLKMEGNELILYCKNTTFGIPEANGYSTGTGIQNAQRRLELAYQDRYSLDISRNQNSHETTLNITLL